MGLTNLADDVFFAGVELGAFVDVVAAGVASDAHRKHHADLDLLILGAPDPGQLGRVEVRRVVLVENLTLSHGWRFSDAGKIRLGGNWPKEGLGILETRIEILQTDRCLPIYISQNVQSVQNKAAH